MTSLRTAVGAVRRTKLISSITALALVISGLVAVHAEATLASTTVVPTPAGRLIAAGRSHTLVIDDGVVYGTGVNGTSAGGTGRLTGSGTGYRTSLLRLRGLPDGVRAISVAAGGAHTLVLGSDHVVYGTGDNNGPGQLTGTGGRETLTDLSGLPGDAQPIAIAAGNAHSLVLGSDGKAYGTGRNNIGQLTGTNGRTTFGELRIPTDGVLAIAIDAGGDYSLVLGDNGKVYGTGLNSDSQLTRNTGETSINRVTLTELIGLPHGVTATAMSAGDNHSLVLGSNGKVYGAGRNTKGQLTGTTTNDISSLTELSSLPSGVIATAIAAGANHSLVLGSNGKVYGAGSNKFGELTGTNAASRTTLTELTGLPAGVRAAALDAGGSQALGAFDAGTSLVVGGDGLVYGAGYNMEGALTGAGDRLVLTPLTATQVAAGNGHSVVLARDGVVYGTGRNDFGQLTGGPNGSGRKELTKFSGLPDDAQPVAIAAGANHSLVLDSNGNVYGTGRNNLGQLTGTGDRLTLTLLDGLPGGHHAVAIAAGADTSLVLGSNGKVYGTGNNSSRQLTGNEANYRAFTLLAGSPVSSSATAIAVAAGTSHSLVLDRDNGPVYGTGSDNSGALAGKGDLNILTSLGTPFVGGVHPAVAAGGSTTSGFHSLMLAGDRVVYGVGSNKFGQLTGTNNTVVAPFTPLSPLPNGAKATAIAAGDSFSLVMGSDGFVYGTGGNFSGELTGSGRRSALTLLGGLPSGVRATAIAAGVAHTLVVGSDGSVYGTGNNQFGQITDIGTLTTTRNRLTPLRGLPNRTPIVAVAAGAAHTLALDNNGSVYGTGRNTVGQLTGTTSQAAFTPVALPDGVHATAIAASSDFSLILGSNGVAYGTGNNSSGQLTGTGNRNSLTRLNGLPSGVKATAIAAGSLHSLVLGSNGEVYGTGNNHFGQLTDIDEIGAIRRELTPLSALPDGVQAIAIAAGSNHSLVVGDNGKVYGTGDNSSGQLTGFDTPTCLKPSDACSDSVPLKPRAALPPPVDTNRWALTALTGLPDNVAAYAVAAGANHSLVLAAGHRIYGTGDNRAGQLNSSVAGDSLTTLTLTPLDGSTERPPAVAVAANGDQSFAIRQGLGSSVTAVGGNGDGQLAVRDVAGTAAAAGERHALVIDSDGGVYGAGVGEAGQLTGTDARAEATSLTGLSAIRAGLFKAPPAPAAPIVSVAAAGSHTLALDSNGTVYGTGRNDGRQLTGAADQRTTLAKIPGLPAGVQARRIAAGHQHSLVLADNGTVYGTGQNNVGQLTGTDTVGRAKLTPLAGLPDGVQATAIAAGVSHSLALGDDGKVYGTGSNLFGQLTGTDASRNQLTELTGLPEGVQASVIAAGGFQSLVLGSDGVVWATGFGDRTTLTPLIGLPDGVLPIAIATSGSHRLVLGSDGDVYGHGDNHCRQLTGTDTDQRDTLTRLAGLPDDVDATAIAAGGGNCGNSLVVGSNGTVYGAGDNFRQQLTGRDTGDISTLTPLSGLAGGVSQAAGFTVGSAGDHTVVIGSDGAVYGTGRNGNGQLTGYEGGRNRTTLTRFTGLLTN